MSELDTTGRTVKGRTVRSDLVVGRVRKRTRWLRYTPWQLIISEESTAYPKESK